MSSWNGAIYFVLFEFTYWTSQNKFSSYVNLMVFDDVVLPFTIKRAMSLVGIIISIWFFKKFLDNVFEVVKK